MAKPWARYEIGFIKHAKFLALNANAICLWIEGKNYADTHATDGLLPIVVVRQFRFYSTKTVGLLMQSAGQKSERETYVPLWEAHAVGFKMHDYLEHNPCREEVLERLSDADERAELRRLKNKERQQRFREERQNAIRNAPVTPSVTPSVTPKKALRNAAVTPVTRPPTDPEADTDTDTEETRTRTAPPPDARSNRLVFRGRKLVVFDWMLDNLLKMLDPHGETFGLDVWFDTLDQRCVERGEIPPDRDNGAWLKAVTLTEAQRRGLPLRVAATAPLGKTTSRLLAAVQNINREGV